MHNDGDDLAYYQSRSRSSDAGFLVAAFMLCVIIAAGNIVFNAKLAVDRQLDEIAPVSSQLR